MKKLTPHDAQKIHNIILSSGELLLVAKYKEALRAEAEMRAGLRMSKGGWQGTELPDSLAQKLREKFGFTKFGINTLAKTKVVSAGGAFIELSLLTDALPEETVSTYLAFDPAQRAQEAGLDFAQFTNKLRGAFRGTVGAPGQEDFGILLDASVENPKKLYAIAGLKTLVHPCEKATVDRLLPKMKKGDLSKSYRIAVRQGQQVHERGIDAASVYIVTPDCSPLAVKTLSNILNLKP